MDGKTDFAYQYRLLARLEKLCPNWILMTVLILGASAYSMKATSDS